MMNNEKIVPSHEDKETLTEDFLLPTHNTRETTTLFTQSRHALLERDGAKCFCCGMSEAQNGKPLEAHHVWIERCLANGVSWTQFRLFIIELKKLIDAAYDFVMKNPTLPDIMTFVDDMRVNGMLLCKLHHTARGTGIHRISFPFWLFQNYGKDGYRYTEDEILHNHE